MKPKELFAAFYLKHCTLLDYLSAVKDRLHCPNDTKAYKKMLKQTTVCYHDNDVDLHSFTPRVREGFHMRDILQRVVEISCHSLSGSSGNIISIGYQLVRDRNNSTGCASSTATVVNKYPNSAVEVLSAKCWQILHKRIGDDLMIHLLRDLSLFVMVKNNCYMQIAGYPMYNLECIRREEQEDEWSSNTQELPDDYDVYMQQTTEQDISQMAVFLSHPGAQEVLPIQQDFGQDLEEEPMEEGNDYKAEISQAPMVEEQSLAPKVVRQEQECQTFSQRRKEAENFVNADKIPQNIAVLEMNSCAPHSPTRQQQNRQVDGLKDQQMEWQRHKRGNAKGTKRKKPSGFEEPFAKKARCSYPARPKSIKLKDLHSNLCSNIFHLYFPQPALMYSTNLGNKFPKSHLLSSTPVSKRGATKLIENIFIQSKFVLDNKKKQIRNFGKKCWVQGEGKKKKINQRLPKRFVRMKELFERMLKRHKKCHFGALLKHHCKGVLDISEEKEKAEKLDGIQENLAAGQEKLNESLVQVEKKCTGMKKENVSKSKQEKYDRAVQNFTLRFQVNFLSFPSISSVIHSFIQPFICLIPFHPIPSIHPFNPSIYPFIHY